MEALEGFREFVADGDKRSPISILEDPYALVARIHSRDSQLILFLDICWLRVLYSRKPLRK
jgi:hypothetical protein